MVSTPHKPITTGPQTPHTPCTEKAPTGSSISAASKAATENTTIIPPTAPAAHAPTKPMFPQPAVILTSPASIPLIIIVRSGLPEVRVESTVAVIAPPAAANVVVTATYATYSSIASSEPGLKPYQPIHNIRAPSVASAILCPGIACGLPSKYLPILGPSNIAPTKPAQPPTE